MIISKMQQKPTIPLFLLAASLLIGLPAPARAQNAPAAPVEAVETEELGAGVSALTVVELFSSQACVFCPKADSMLADLIQNENIIGLACHVDYFDVSVNSLSRPFCTERQNMYEAALRAGPNFTPQMVINGAYDAVGYRLEDVSDTIHKAERAAPAPIAIAPGDNPDVFAVSLPELKTQAGLMLHALFLDKPHKIQIADGSNRGKNMTYYNIVSRIDPMMEWDGAAKDLAAKITLGKGHKGFVILAQDKASGRILAAGQYARPVQALGPVKN